MESDAQFVRRMSTSYVRTFRDLPTPADAQRLHRLEDKAAVARIFQALKKSKD